MDYIKTPLWERLFVDFCLLIKSLLSFALFLVFIYLAGMALSYGWAEGQYLSALQNHRCAKGG